MKKKDNIIKGFKAFNNDMKCRDFKYEVDNTYTSNEKPIKCTSNGFHFCENPLDIFSYYPPTSKFHKVTGSGEIDKGDESDSKVCVSQITINEEITLNELINEGVKFIINNVDFTNACESNTGDYSAATNTGYNSAATNTGYNSAATNTGNYSAATNTGDNSAATNTGHYSAASVEGKESVACGLGYDNKVKACLGSAIVLVERDINYKLINIKSAIIDGVVLKADTYYKLINGEFVECL